MPVCQKIEYLIKRILVNLDCGGNHLKYNNDLHESANKDYALQNFFKTDFVTQ